MKQFGTILKFELKNYFKNKIFVGVTIVSVALIAVVMFFPRIMTAFESEESEAEAVDEIVGMMLLSTEGVENPKEIQQAFEMAFLEYEVCIADKDIKAIEEKVISGYHSQ